MKKHNAVPLLDLVEIVENQEVNLVACTMTMDLLGLQKKELMNKIEYANVGA